ncbi:MAG: hypothetical protein JRG76_18860 [Deltaproteobacteria bacterium]|nr:hypothetical protein [Deltaproteobacteria bacterium]
MWKYWVFMLVVLGLALVYAYLSDPCIGLVRSEFSARYPDRQLVSSDADSGSPESVRCVVSYRESGSQEVESEVWWYRNKPDGWQLYKILEPEPAANP